MTLVNGRPSDSIHTSDRGLHYGDGVFETVAVDNGAALALEEHLLRLQAGARALGFPEPDAAQILNEVDSMISPDQRAVMKIVLTRGRGGRGYRPPAIDDTVPSRIISLHEWPEYDPDMYEQGIVLRLCKTRLSQNPALAGIKHLNRLEQVLARNEWRDTGVFEGLMLDTDGDIIEGTMSNLFMFVDGVLLTPSLDGCGIHGIVRKLVMDIAAELEINCRVTRLGLEDMERASEIFICNSVLGLCHVRAYQNHSYDPPVLCPQLREGLIKQQKIAAL